MDEFDFVVANIDMIEYIPSLRGLLKNKFPTNLNGQLKCLAANSVNRKSIKLFEKFN